MAAFAREALHAHLRTGASAVFTIQHLVRDKSISPIRGVWLVVLPRKPRGRAAAVAGWRWLGSKRATAAFLPQ